MNRRSFVTHSLALPFLAAPRFNPRDTSWQVAISNDAVRLSGVPPFVERPIYSVMGVSEYRVSGRTVVAHELRVDTGPRSKRCFVLVPPNLEAERAVLGVAWPGSNSEGLGAQDLFNRRDTLRQQQWPLRIVARYRVFMVAIDLPLFGPVPAYQDHPDEPLGPILDDIHAIQAARDFIEKQILPHTFKHFDGLERQMFCGGLSWGASRSLFTMAACPDIAQAYIGSSIASKLHDLRPAYNPVDWGPDYDYADLAINASKWCDIRWQFGGDGRDGNNADYLHAPFTTGNPEDEYKLYFAPNGDVRPVPNTARILTVIEERGRGISTHINQNLAHELDFDDMRAWLRPYLTASA
jgi:hypothetical protein